MIFIFNFIRYANSWEDTDTILGALDVKENDSVLSICAAGDNPLSFLVKNPSKVFAIDINKTQIYLLMLKMESFRNLDYKTLLDFLGVNNCDSRVEIYNRFKNKLSSECRDFWDDNISYIEEGVIHIGKFESYFKVFRTKVLPMIHSQKTINTFLSFDSIDEQKSFYDNKWNSLRWKVLFKIFFGKKVMGKLGRDKSFFDFVKVDVASNIKKRVEIGFSNTLNKTNPYFNYILKGSFTKESLPHYLREENYELIKNNLDKIHFFLGDVTQCLNTHKGEINKLYLSDIFEYMSEEDFISNINVIENSVSKKDGKFIYYNMLADRIISDNSSLKINHELSNDFHKKDKSFFYKRTLIGDVIQ